jgi:hypothetical protein
MLAGTHMANSPEIEINNHFLINTVAGAALGQGLLDDGIGLEKTDKKIIVVAAAPKTGSTYLTNTLMRLTNSRGFRLSSAYSTNEHDLYLPALCIIRSYGCVSQLHMKGTFHNAYYLRKFGIKPVILVRRIEDIVVSLGKDLRGKEQLPGYGTGRDGYSFLWQDQCTRDLDDDRLLDMIIDLALPWYVNFYVSWYRLCEQKAVDSIWITYEEMIAGKEATVKKVLDFLGYQPPERIDENILSGKYDTYRENGTGQAENILTGAQRDRIRNLFSYYPDIDFGKYGI